MKNHILAYSLIAALTFLVFGCDKFDRTEVVPQVYVNKSSISGFVGLEVQLTASPTDGSYSFEWSSEDPAIATVSNAGLVKLLSEGTTHIVLSAGDIKQRVQVSSLTRIPVSEVRLSESAIELVPQAVKNVSVQMLPASANDIPKAVWSTENDKVATVSEKGEVTGVGEGSTSVHFKVGEITKTVAVIVSYTRPFNGPHILQAGPTLEIKAADFDFGGIGRAFNDDPGTALNDDSYRRSKGDNNSLAVEIEGGGTNIGFVGNGEWYQYSVDVKEAGNYQLQVSLSAAGASKYHVEVDNVNVTGSVDLASNGSWSSWVNHPGKPIVLNLAAGRRKIKFVADVAAFNIRALRFTKE